MFFKVVLYEFTSTCIVIYSYMDNKQQLNAYYMYCESFGAAIVVFEVLVPLACLVANY